MVLDEGMPLSDFPTPHIDTLVSLLKEWNEKINVISRKDTDELYERHILPCLAFLEIAAFPAGARVLDLGCGGGLPGLPLAIAHPDVSFTLLDSVGKKTIVAEAIANEMDLKNITVINDRAENIKQRFDFITGRAVTALPRFLEWAKPMLSASELPNAGIYYWKGGELEAEIQGFPYAQYFLNNILPEKDYYTDKYIIHLPTSCLK